MITASVVRTPRISINALRAGDPQAETILFIHGNLSSSTFWERTMLAFEDAYHCIAPDLRGFGATQALKVNAALGLADMAEDLLGLLDCLALPRCHVVGHSMGGGVAMRMMLMRPERLRSVALVNTISPFGYTGSVDEDGKLLHADGSPGGAGCVERELVRRLSNGDRSRESPFSPRNILEQLYFKPPFLPDNIEGLLDSMLSTRIGEDWYPGDTTQPECGPGPAPGARGIVNAMSRRYFNASGIVNIHPKPPVLWIRGRCDLIVRDEEGDVDAAPQPMIRQTRAVLQGYRREGGVVTERLIEDAGHTPFIEKPTEFNAALRGFLRSCHARANGRL